MSNLRQAAQQALVAMGINQYTVAELAPHKVVMQFNDAITALRAALENEFNPDWDQVVALQEYLREHTAQIQRLRAALAEDALQRLTDVQQEMEAALAEQCPHGVTDGNCKECYVAEQEPVVDCPRCGHCCPQRKPLTGEEIAAIVREAAKGSAIKRDGSTSQRIARAIEAHHGIGEKK